MSGTVREYLGDSVYVEALEIGTYRLYLDNGMGEHSEIYLEPSVVEAFERFRNRVEEPYRKGGGE